MEKKEIFRKVGMIVAELNEQYQYLSENPESLNDLELELFLANANFLTDHIEILRKINGAGRPQVAGPQESSQLANSTEENVSEAAGTPSQVTEKQSVVPDDANEINWVESAAVSEPENRATSPGSEASKEGHEEKHPESTGEKNAAAFNAEINNAPEVPATHSTVLRTEEIVENTDRVPEGNNTTTGFKPEAAEPASAMPQEIIKEVVIPEKTITVTTEAPAEAPAAVPTINEMISAKVNPPTVATRFTSHPVADLKSIISLNDKLLFVKDLFNGYNLAYSEAIELINRFDSFESADHFLKANYAAKNNWSEKQATVDKLYEALNRRFAK